MGVKIESLINKAFMSSLTIKSHNNFGLIAAFVAEIELTELEQLYFHRITNVLVRFFHFNDCMVHSHVVQGRVNTFVTLNYLG